jgi:putative transcriptional regulator
MRDDLFNELLESVKEAGAIRRGAKAPARRTTAADLGIVDVREVRSKLKLSGPKFARLLGVSPRTLEGWEQRRRVPDGAARVLISVAAEHPAIVLETVRAMPAPASAGRGGAPKKRRLRKAS